MSSIGRYLSYFPVLIALTLPVYHLANAGPRVEPKGLRTLATTVENYRAILDDRNSLHGYLTRSEAEDLVHVL